ncbi:MAG: hypothetical protein ABR601_09020 [Parasphingopyxis sp.]|nr:hypothetical protein [Sphingomonadales bacterium]
MAHTADYCRERAAAAEQAADEASLSNVRQRELRARETWLEMAHRADRTAAMRDRLAAEKAAREV